jgi:phospholipid transport system transporter-binding protein
VSRTAEPDSSPPAGGFAASDDGDRWVYSGALTFYNVSRVVDAARELPLPASGRVDLAALDHADSSALAALFALKRRARAEHKRLVFEHLPPGLASLATVYGVDSLLDG